MSDTISGNAGSGVRLRVEHCPPTWDPAQSASIDMWLLTLPGQAPAWSQYGLACVHLRPVPGESKPAHKFFANASHEFVVIAFEPEPDGSVLVATDAKHRERNYRERQGRMLSPANYVHQVAGISDEQARHITELLARAFVNGIMPAEPGGITINGVTARRYCGQMIDNTVQHVLSGGHASPSAS